MEAIEVEALTKDFDGLTAVDHITFKVKKGSIFGFLGLNGAGKTTTVRMLTTLLRPTEGEAWVNGCSVINERMKVKELIGIVPEDTVATQPDWTPVEYLRFFGSIHGMDHKLINEKNRDLLELLELSDRARDPLKDYSSGMKKRVEIARALLPEPEILFLDEPTKELDIPGKRQIWDMLLKLKEGGGATIFLSSHDIREIEVLCEDVCVIHKGKLVFKGSTQNLKGTRDELESKVIRLLRGEVLDGV